MESVKSVGYTTLMPSKFGWIRSAVSRKFRSIRSVLHLDFRSIRYGSWIYWGFFILSPLAAAVLNLVLPQPGIAIAFLAVAAFVATFRDKITHRQKLIWALAIFGLFTSEIRAINHERVIQDNNTKDLNSKFGETLGTLQKELSQIESLKQRWQIEADFQDLMNRELAAQTIEKGQFVYALARSNNNEQTLTGDSWQLDIRNSGDEPLNDVYVEVQALGKSEAKPIGVLGPSNGGPYSTNFAVKPGFYIIEMSTRYNHFQEGLEILEHPRRPGVYIQKAWIQRPFDGKEIWTCCPPLDCLRKPCKTS